jgi:hypothetical protein
VRWLIANVSLRLPAPTVATEALPAARRVMRVFEDREPQRTLVSVRERQRDPPDSAAFFYGGKQMT